AVYDMLTGVHVAAAFLFTAFIAMHIAAALKHLLIDRDHVFARMLGVAAVAVLFALPLAALAAPFAYVPNEGSGPVSVIDTATDQVIAEIPAGKKPEHAVFSPDGRQVFVSAEEAEAIDIVDVDQRPHRRAHQWIAGAAFHTSN